MPLEEKLVAYWLGVPISEIPREELEREFIIAQRRIQLLEDAVTRYSIDNMQLLSRLAQRGV